MRDQIKQLLQGQLHNPFTVLGKQRDGDTSVVLVYLPEAVEVELDGKIPMPAVGPAGLFECRTTVSLAPHYRINWRDRQGCEHSTLDPYSFSPWLSDDDLQLIGDGNHRRLHRVLGANQTAIDGIKGILFATWAPNARRVSVVGDFNNWNGLQHPMCCTGQSGIWTLFIPELTAGLCYKYEILDRHNKRVMQKIDPCGRAFEQPPKTAAVISIEQTYEWRDDEWLAKRRAKNWLEEPISVYEVQLGSWRHNAEGGFLNYRNIADQLIPYIHTLGFTHIELMPITEFPFDGSWGYQTTGYFAPSSRFGSADDFRYFVDVCHRNNIGVLLDWVVSHFPKDDHALSRYDGTALYEHEDPEKGEHPDWGTAIFNYHRKEVKSFLISNALFWLEEFHLDGLRVDAVASMLYLDYSREPGQWTPNHFGGNENLEAVEFLKELNQVVHQQAPGCLMIAEESTDWPQVSRPTYLGGLGFSMKWNMGWMHDTLDYLREDPVHRRYHHDKLTFGLMYNFQENFMLALSHDEVVHGKSSLLQKMPGDDWQKFANLRLLYTFMFTYPGKKLLFMGGEFAQRDEWDHDSELQWELLKHAPHQTMQRLIKDLNAVYCNTPALYENEFDPKCFRWIDCHDSDQSVLSYLRQTEEQHCFVVLNFTPVPRYAYRIGVPATGEYRECLNSDSAYYGGCNIGNLGSLRTEAVPWMGYDQSVSLTLPPLAALVIERREASAT